jgi:RNA polymerase sigma factor (sigma-70 family)
MRDSDIVALLAAGERKGLEAAYTAYAARIYDYAHSMLRQADGTAAADVTHDTFLIALAKASGLRDPDRFRSWLYAIARNECLRVLRQSKRTDPLPSEDQQPGKDRTRQGSPDMAADLSRSELGELVHAAAAGLSPKDREVFDLGMRHDLQAGEIAKALGVSENAAHAMLSRVRGQFKKSLGALSVARSGRRTCAVLDGLLSGWDGSFAPLWRKRIARHVEHCKSCSKVQGRELSPAALLTLAPLLGAPVLVRERLFGPDLDLVSADTSKPVSVDTTTALVGIGRRLADRSGPFAPDGFPGQAVGGRRRAAALVLTAMLMVVVGGGWWFTRGDAVPELESAAPTSIVSSSIGAPYSLQPGETLSTSAATKGPLKSDSATAPPSDTASIPGTPPQSGPSSPTSAPNSVPSSDPTTATSSPGTVPSSVLTTSSSSGTLAITPTSLTMRRGASSTVRLTAQGSTVDWAATREGAAGTYTSLSQYSGTLAGGASTAVTITVSSATPSTITQLVVVFGPGDKRVVITLA